MGAVSIRDRSELSQARAAILGPKHERFAVFVASGMSYRASAELAGFCRDYGYDLMQIPKVKERVESLIAAKAAEPDSVASRPWLEAQMTQVIVDAMYGIPAEAGPDGKLLAPATPKDRQLARLAIMDLCRIKGYIIERKQVDSRRLDLGKVSHAELSAMLDAQLGELAPGERAKIKAIARGRQHSDEVIELAPEAGD